MGAFTSILLANIHFFHRDRSTAAVFDLQQPCTHTVYNPSQRQHVTQRICCVMRSRQYRERSGARCKYKTGLVNTYSVSTGPVQFNATWRSHMHKSMADYQLNMLLSILMNEIDSSLDTGQGAWQTQKTAVWNRSRRDRPISRELSVAWLDRSPISRLWRPVLYLQCAPVLSCITWLLQPHVKRDPIIHDIL